MGIELVNDEKAAHRHRHERGLSVDDVNAMAPTDNYGVARRPSGPDAPVILAENLTKAFGGQVVLSDVSLEVQSGEIHALLGQNGAGKSTLIKILAGYHAPEPGGRLLVRGEPVRLPLAPGLPRQLGISFVHQDLGLALAMSVVENLAVGQFRTGRGYRIKWKEERRRARTLLAEFGLDVSPEAHIGSLPSVERAMVAIVRAFERQKGVTRGLLVLDEPTAYLPRDGVERLFTAVRQAAARGAGVLFVTHKLDEVRRLADRVTILRGGRRVECAATAAITEAQLIERILGRELTELYPPPPGRPGAARLRVAHVEGALANDVSFEARAGEIIGLTGLLGMGHEEVPYLLFGATRAKSGTMQLDESVYDVTRLTPRAALNEGVALLPGDRLQAGAAGEATVRENVTLANLRSYYSKGVLWRRREGREVEGILQRFQVNPTDPTRVFGTLSGGNQQKALVGKWLTSNPKVLLLHEPTQGVDVGARQQIFSDIRRAALKGAVVVLASGEYEDLAHLCNRVFVFRNGSIVAELQGEALTHENILQESFRSTRQTPRSRGPRPEPQISAPS